MEEEKDGRLRLLVEEKKWEKVWRGGIYSSPHLSKSVSDGRAHWGERSWCHVTCLRQSLLSPLIAKETEQFILLAVVSYILNIAVYIELL